MEEMWKKADPWINDIKQIHDPDKRKKALESILAAIQGDDPHKIHAGVAALRATGDINYDKIPFREPVLELIQRLNGEALETAFYALFMTGIQQGDLDLLLDAHLSEERGISSTHLICLYTKGKIEGRAAEVVLKMLGTKNMNALRNVLCGLSNCSVPTELEAKLLELSKTGLRHEAFHFTLSKLQNKSRTLIKALVEALDDPNRQIVQMALDGICCGIPAESQDFVSDTLLKVFETYNEDQIRHKCLHFLAGYGNETHMRAVEMIAGNEMLSDAIKVQAQHIMKYYKEKKWRWSESSK
jgi:hypothetical protein